MSELKEKNQMDNFQSLISAYLAAHPDLLPPADAGAKLNIQNEQLQWRVSTRNGGEVFEVIIHCEDLLGWIWSQGPGKLATEGR